MYNANVFVDKNKNKIRKIALKKKKKNNGIIISHCCHAALELDVLKQL